jgi:hypothetical protein
MQGANPSQWYGTFEDIPIAGLLLQQLVDFRRWETKERIAREEQLAQIAILGIDVQALPLPELRGKARFARNAAAYFSPFRRSLRNVFDFAPGCFSSLVFGDYKSVVDPKFQTFWNWVCLALYLTTGCGRTMTAADDL